MHTSDGDLVLDNRTSHVKRWSATGYRYFARQSQTKSDGWEQIR